MTRAFAPSRLRQLLRSLGVCGAFGLMNGALLAQDSFEPDNSAPTAKPINNGTIQNRTLDVDDEDWAVFTIGTGGATTLRVETAITAANGDTQIWLYSAQSLTKEIAYNDDAAPTTKASLITLTTLAPGTYYVRVTSVNPLTTVNGYALRVTWTDRPDVFEADNTAATAKPIANGQIQERSIHLPEDEDWATFTIGGDGATDLRIETTGTAGDTEMWLYGPNSSTTQLAYNDDFGTEKFSRITQSTLAAGTYFIKVAAFGRNGTISGYTLRTTWSDRGDAFESDDTAATAKPIANGATQNRSIHVAGDVDWATFTVGSAGATNVRIETAGATGDTQMWLYGPNSSTAQLAQDDDSGVGSFSLITRPSLAPGTYFIRVGAFGLSSTINTYTLQASWTELVSLPTGDNFESDNTDATAKPIANGELQNRSIHVANDVDWATFTIGINGASAVRIETAGPSGDTEMWLYGPDNASTQIAHNDDGGSSGFSLITQNSLGAGKYFIKVVSFGAKEPIPAYTLRAAWVNNPTPTSRLINLSIRTDAGAGAQTVIVGFVVSGAGTKQFLLRGVGPTLSTFGVTGVLADPTMQLFSGTTSLATNDNWGGTAAIREAATSVGAFPLPDASRDAALLQTVGAGAYTVQIGGGSGVALAEAYEVGSAVAPKLINVSARSQVGTGAGTLIVGFVIGGQGPKSVLIRAVGPSLSQFGVTGVLANPKLDVFAGTTLVESNDNWGGGVGLTSLFTQLGAFTLPANSLDAVLYLSLQPGAYSAQVTGVGNTTGTALIEVYEAP